MEYECGFDIVPRLNEEEHCEDYNKFIAEVVKKYAKLIDRDSPRADGRVLEYPDDDDVHHEYSKLRLRIGDCPVMPYRGEDCALFLSFSSDVSGANASAKTYVKAVCKIAKKHFGYRVRFWHQLNEGEDGNQGSYYDLEALYNADQALDALG